MWYNCYNKAKTNIFCTRKPFFKDKNNVNMKKICHLIGTLLLFFSSTVSGQGLLTEQAPLPCLNKNFTIVAHIVRDTFGADNITEAEIEAAMIEVNEAFEPICTGFQVCDYRYIDNFQYDDIGDNDWDEMQIQYNQDNRINIYFVSGIDVPNECGFATPNGITMMESGGIAILKGNDDCPIDNTIIHELGHYFGLLNTFEGNGTEFANGSNCETEGDLICDTPADPYTLGDPLGNYISIDDGCRFTSQLLDANGQFYEPDVGNYMSAYPAECTCGFTYEQFLKMANTYLAEPNMW